MKTTAWTLLAVGYVALFGEPAGCHTDMYLWVALVCFGSAIILGLHIYKIQRK